jgi:hypothetical protein
MTAPPMFSGSALASKTVDAMPTWWRESARARPAKPPPMIAMLGVDGSIFGIVIPSIERVLEKSRCTEQYTKIWEQNDFPWGACSIQQYIYKRRIQ